MFQFRSFIGPLFFLALLGLAAFLFVKANVDSVATRFVQSELDNFLFDSGFTAIIKAANYVEGTGLELRGLQLFDSENDHQLLLTIDSILIRFPTEISELVLLQVKPTSVDIRRAKVMVRQESIDRKFVARARSVFERQPQQYPLIPIRIRDSILGFLPSGPSTGSMTTNFALDVNSDSSNGHEEIRITCQANGDHVKQFEATALVDIAARKWQINVNNSVTVLSDELLKLIPNNLLAQQDKLNGVRGICVATATIASTFDSSSPTFAAVCRVADLSIVNEKMPLPLAQCGLEVTFDNNGIELKRAHGRLGDGDFDLSYRQTGFPVRAEWQSSGAVNNLKFDHKLVTFFPGLCEKFCKDFSPNGTFDLQFEVDSNGLKDITAQIKDMSFSFYRFPFAVENCVGSVKWLNENLDFKVQSLENQQLIEFSGHVHNPGDEATYVFNFGTNGRLPINQKLLNSLKEHPAMDRAFRDFRPVGFVNGHGTIEKRTSNAEIIHKDVQIQLHDCAARHRLFDYPVQNVGGTIQITHEGLAFQEIVGSNSSGQAMCNGIWNPQDGLRLVFNCQSMQLDDRLRNALSPNLQDIWDGFQPGGMINSGRVFLDYLPDSKFLDVRIQANLGEQEFGSNGPTFFASIKPDWFPYRIENLTGNIEIGGGVVTLTDLLGQHGKTSISCSGTGRYSDTNWSVNLVQLLAGSVTPDDDLLHALPIELSDAVRNLSYLGQINLSGGISFAGTHANSALLAATDYSQIRQVAYETGVYPVDVGWDLRLDIDQGKMQIGLPLENIFGSVRLKGKSSGEITECSGEVSIDSLTIYDMQVTNIQGPIWIDNNQTLAGKFVNSSETDSPSLVGDLFDGKIILDAWVSHRDKFPFFVQTIVEKAELEELAAEVIPQMKELSGDGYGFVQIQGNTNEPHTYTGKGNIHLREAKIHQLPVILSLLKILSIKELTRTAFDMSNVDFSVKGNQVKLDRIELIGDAISLIGNGYLELGRHTDVNFYSVVGRNRTYIPLLSELYRAGSQRIMWINIGGPLDNLKTRRKVLPGLDDSIRALLKPENSSRQGVQPELNFRRN